MRTCSNKLDIKMQVSLVCMQESRPGDGELCFCHKDECNGAPPSMTHVGAQQSKLLALLLSLLSLFTVNMLTRSHCDGSVVNHSSIPQKECSTSSDVTSARHHNIVTIMDSYISCCEYCQRHERAHCRSSKHRRAARLKTVTVEGLESVV